MTIEDSIKWIESKAEEQEKLGNILEAEDYMQVAEYLRDLKCGQIMTGICWVIF